MKALNILISGTSFWNPGDDFIRDGVIEILKRLYKDNYLNFMFYNFNEDFLPYSKFKGVHNMVSPGDVGKLAPHLDLIVIAGLPVGREIKDLYLEILKHNLTDKVILVAAGYENFYIDRHIVEYPEIEIFKRAKIITGRTAKRPPTFDEHNLNFHHINCPALLSVPEVKKILPEKKIEHIGMSIQIPYEMGIINQATGKEMFELNMRIMQSLYGKYKITLVAHHKTEYFSFLNFIKNRNLDIDLIFSSFYQDLHDVYREFDMVISTRLHACLYGLGHGIPGIVINETGRHTHCLDGFIYVPWVNNFESFEQEFQKMLTLDLSKVSKEVEQFKIDLVGKYLTTLAPVLNLSPKVALPCKPENDKLNIGCGNDYKEGFVNIDGNTKLERVDYVFDINPKSLKEHFQSESFSYILAQDFIEHHFHWEAIELLSTFHSLLKPDGYIDLRLPNVESLLDSDMKIEDKIKWLYGGQDIGSTVEGSENDDGRKSHPQYYCHKYGWTSESIVKALESLDYSNITVTRIGVNMQVTAYKSGDFDVTLFDEMMNLGSIKKKTI
jgi:hypothetical protein